MNTITSFGGKYPFRISKEVSTPPHPLARFFRSSTLTESVTQARALNDCLLMVELQDFQA